MRFESPYKRSEIDKEPELQELEEVSRRLEQLNESLGYDQNDPAGLTDKAATELRRVVKEVTKSE